MASTVGYPKKISEVGGEKAATEKRRMEQLLERGRRHRQKRESAWQKSEDQYNGNHWGAMIGELSPDSLDLITVNISFSTVNTIVPYITGEEPNFLVEPYSGDATVRKARIQQALLNRTWRSYGVQGQNSLEDAAVDMLIYGDGYIRVGYTITEKRLDEGKYAEVAQLSVRRVDPWDVWIDPLADGLHNARWVCQRILTTYGELKGDPRFEVPADFQPTVAPRHASDDHRLRDQLTNETFDRDDEYVVLYEFFDLVNRTAVTFSDGSDMPLRWIDDTTLPLAQLANYRIPRSPYHMGELEQIWSLQMELNQARSQMVTHRRRNAQKILAKVDALSDDAMDALQSSEVNAVIPIQGDLPLDQLVTALNVPNLSADVYAVSDTVTRDVYEISGVNEYLRGATPEIRRTATEATIIEGASNVKSRYKLKLIEKGARDVGNLMLGIMRDVYPMTDFDELTLFLTGADAEAITRLEFGEGMGEMIQGGAPEEEMLAYAEQNDPSLFSDAKVTPSSELFEGTYEVFVESHSTELRNPIMKEQRAREMFMALAEQAPLLQQMGVQLNMRKLLEAWLEAAGVHDIDGVFEAANPMAMMGQQGGGMPGNEAGQMPAGDPMQAMLAMGAMTSENTGTMPPA
jgi:hypothetical protein